VVTWFEGSDLTGNFTTIDLIAASTSALNGALLARRPDHFKNFTIVGILAMALLAGLGGGITRDVLLACVPVALTNPAYITLALAFGVLGYMVAYAQGQLFREGRGTRSVPQCQRRCHGELAPFERGRPRNAKSPAVRGLCECAEEDSNLHPVIPDQALNLARLPIPPSAQGRGAV
jgi:hypothetical protein